jgi:hypothetical protein
VVDRHGGRPLLTLKLVALNKSGAYGCCAVRGVLDDAKKNVVGPGFFVHDARGPRLEPGSALLPPMTQAERDSVPWR